MRRDKRTLYLEVLRLIGDKQGIGVTHIMYQTNLSYTICKEILDYCIEKGIVRFEGETHPLARKRYYLTDSGTLTQSSYRQIRQVLESLF